MNHNETGHNNLLDTTDCLEAVGVFKGWKNILFIVVLVVLLLSQAGFWLVDLGIVTLKDDSPVINIASGISIPVTFEPNQTAAQPVNKPSDANTQAKSKLGDLFEQVPSERYVLVLSFVDAVLILTASLYCLTMLFALKVSMVGRLGGINHITRAFFLSMFLLILLLPWQKVFGSTVIGAVFTAEDIIQASSLKSGDILEKVLYYLRFTGYSLLILLLLLMAQLRSARWAGAILRRLEII
jgi:hypothetical protein